MLTKPSRRAKLYACTAIASETLKKNSDLGLRFNLGTRVYVPETARRHNLLTHPC